MAVIMAQVRAGKKLEKLFDFFTKYYFRNWVSGISCVSEYSKKQLSKKKVDSNKITVIHNGISDAITPSPVVRYRLRREWCIDDGDILLGLACRLDRVKGISYLLDAFSKASKRIPQLKLVLIGIGPLEGILKEKVKSLGLSKKILFPGFRSDVGDCLFAIDIFILPSLKENHSISLLEAMRAQRPIIVTDVGGNTESVRNEKEALVVPPADVNSLTNAIERLATTETLRNRLARAAYSRFQREFTAEKALKKTAEWMMCFDSGCS